MRDGCVEANIVAEKAEHPLGLGITRRTEIRGANTWSSLSISSSEATSWHSIKSRWLASMSLSGWRLSRVLAKYPVMNNMTLLLDANAYVPLESSAPVLFKTAHFNTRTFCVQSTLGL